MRQFFLFFKIDENDICEVKLQGQQIKQKEWDERVKRTYFKNNFSGFYLWQMGRLCLNLLLFNISFIFFPIFYTFFFDRKKKLQTTFHFDFLEQIKTVGITTQERSEKQQKTRKRNLNIFHFISYPFRIAMGPFSFLAP